MPKPNILLVMSDQHRADILGCNGDPVVHTPHLDRLAAEGTNGTNMHCQGPLCMPARASFLTERYVRDHGVFQNHVDPPRDLPTFLHPLQAEGYHTGCIGKMHLWVHGGRNKPNHTHERAEQMRGYGFDEPIETVGKLATVGVQSDYTQFLADRDLYGTYQEFVAARMYAHQHADAKLPNWAADPIPLPADAYIDAWHGDRVVRWIREYDKDEPWFLWVGFPGPHDPWDAPVDAIERYADVEMPIPASLRRPDIPDGDSPFAEFLRFFLWNHSDSETFTDERIQAVRRAYYANVTIIDEAVGKMRAALEETNQLDNTWIIYTSDHGEMMGEHRMLMKMVFYDQSTRVPLLVRAPDGSSAAHTIDVLTEHMDLAATIRAIAGGGGDATFEGRSLLPLLDGSGPGPGRDVVFSENYGFGMARTDRHKLVFHEDSLAPGQLFDVHADPTEDTNLVSDQPDVVEEILETHVRPFLAGGRRIPGGRAGVFG